MAQNNLVLIAGESSSGKSASLRGLQNPESVAYLCCEGKKELPFQHKFQAAVVTDPYEVPSTITDLGDGDQFSCIVVDSLTYLMDMFESTYVLTSENTQKAWGDYAQFLKRLMQKHVAECSKNIIFTAHTRQELNSATGIMETKVPVKGSSGNIGVESYFSSVIATKRVPLVHLRNYKNDLLTFTEDELELGYKHVFQTRNTKETVGERIKSPMGMWSIKETYIDNNAQFVLDRLNQFYSK